jgi:hypothetical protein
MKFHQLALVLIAALTGLGGCGPTTYQMTGTEHAAGTDATATVEEIEGGNVLVTLEVEHLAPPGRVSSGMNTYVMWFRGSGDARIGAVLEYDEDDRVGRATATTHESQFEIVVTAESTRSPGSPSEVIVMRRRIGGQE